MTAMTLESSVLEKVHQLEPEAEVLTFRLEGAGNNESLLRDQLRTSIKPVILKLDLTSLGKERESLGFATHHNSYDNQRIKDFYLRFKEILGAVSMSCASFYSREKNDVNFYNILREALKNAFVHGNRLNFNLPIYVYFNPKQNKIMIFDANLPENIKDERYKSELRITHWIIHGRRAGVEYSLSHGVLDLDKVGHAVVLVLVNGMLKNSAQLTKIMKENNRSTGGINLTPTNSVLHTHQAGDGIQFHLDPAMLQLLQNAPGFVPVIIKVQPMVNLRRFLGINDPVGVDKSV